MIWQRHFGEVPFVIGIGTRTSIGIGVALQLAIGVEALAQREAEAACAAHLAVGDGALRGAALGVPGVAGTADQCCAGVLLFVGGHLAVCVVAVADGLVCGGASKLVRFLRHAPCLVVAVGAGVATSVGALCELAGCVVLQRYGAAQRSGFFDELARFVVFELVGIAIGIGYAPCAPDVLQLLRGAAGVEHCAGCAQGEHGRGGGDALSVLHQYFGAQGVGAGGELAASVDLVATAGLS